MNIIADKQMEELNQENYKNFKDLLEYFVAHLEHNANTTPESRKKQLSERLKKKLNGNTFIAQGTYSSIHLQNNISKWSLYPMGRLSITIGSSFGDNWTTKASYIQWYNTGLNIQANWDNDKKSIKSLSYYKYNGYGNREQADKEFSINELDLFSNNDPNEKLKTMLKEYAQLKIKESYAEIENMLLLHKNIILTGAPGTGKTYMAEKIGGKLGVYKKVQFHPSYDYTDFVEGLRPENNGKEIAFVYKQGSFVEFCAKANYDKKNKYIFIIDEINRGELNKIFGELFSCIEEGYRGDSHRVDTQYKNIVSEKITIDGSIKKNPFYEKGFFVPENIYIIGTMNDIDRSVESIDFALRRRFVWKEIGWDFSLYDMMKNIKYDKSIVLRCLNNLNNKISNELGESYCIGGAYIKNLEKTHCSSVSEALEILWNESLSIIIKEYLRGQTESINDCLNKYHDEFLLFAK